jgi:hypothetical protein
MSISDWTSGAESNTRQPLRQLWIHNHGSMAETLDWAQGSENPTGSRHSSPLNRSALGRRLLSHHQVVPGIPRPNVARKSVASLEHFVSAERPGNVRTLAKDPSAIKMPDRNSLQNLIITTAFLKCAHYYGVAFKSIFAWRETPQNAFYLCIGICDLRRKRE